MTHTGRRVRVLLLEDDVADAELACRALAAEQSCDVRVVAGRSDFAAALDAHAPDIVLADYSVPGFTGPQALAMTRALAAPPPFLYVSGTIGEERAVAALREGATDFVLKSELSRLGPAVTRALREVAEQHRREQAQAALAESEQRLRRILDNAQDIIYRFRVAPDRGFDYVSPALAHVLGYSPEDLLARGDDGVGLVHEEDRRRLGRPAGRPQDVELRVRRADGSWAWLEVRSRPVRDEHGQVVAHEGVVRDVTERHEAERRVHRTVVLQSALADMGAYALAHSAENTARVVAAAMEELLGADVVGVFRSDGRRESLWSGSGWSASEPAFAHDDVLADQSGLIVMPCVREVAERSPAAALLHAEGVRTAAAEQLLSGDTTLGVLLIGWREPREPAADERAFIATMASILSTAIARSTMEAELRERVADLRSVDRQRRRLLGRLVSAQEEERRRIAADVHDDSIQILTAVALRLEMLRDAVGEAERDEFEELSDVVRRAMDRLRSLMFALRPPQLDREGLAAALRQYVDATAEDHGPTYELVDRLTAEPAEETRALLYRIVQEALTNVRKHARARRVRVTVATQGDGVLVEVDDDGQGFEPGAQAHDHLGMVAMRERAELAGGRFDVTTRLGAGTTVTAWVPLGLPGEPA